MGEGVSTLHGSSMYTQLSSIRPHVVMQGVELLNRGVCVGVAMTTSNRLSRQS